jgi:hypothetical protein
LRAGTREFSEQDKIGGILVREIEDYQIGSKIHTASHCIFANCKLGQSMKTVIQGDQGLAYQIPHQLS